MAIQILSVSYDQALLLTRQLMLEGQGYEVVSALGFKEAEKRCKDGIFQLLVIGHSIPLTDKQALMEQFRGHSRAPVVSLLRSGEAFVDGADYHVSPDDPPALVREIVRIVPPNGEQHGPA
jgi:DNA-binding NtrC family response regulator